MMHLDEINAMFRVQERLAEAEQVRLQRAVRASRGGGSSNRALRYGRQATGRMLVRAGMAVSGSSEAGLP